MIFNLVFAVYFSTLSELIWTAENSNPDIVTDRDDVRSWGEDLTLDISCGSSSGGSSISNVHKTDMASKKIAKRTGLKYYKNSLPINPKIDDESIGNLRKYESQLLAKGKACKWEKFDELTKEDARDLCKEAWLIQGQRMPELKIKLQDGIILDCDSALIPGSGDNYRSKPYEGYFQYLNELEDKLFFPDLVRCNCAYQKKIMGRGICKTVIDSKRFFFLHKKSDTMYYVFTVFGQHVDKTVKLVDVNKLIVRK